MDWVFTRRKYWIIMKTKQNLMGFLRKNKLMVRIQSKIYHQKHFDKENKYLPKETCWILLKIIWLLKQNLSKNHQENKIEKLISRDIPQFWRHRQIHFFRISRVCTINEVTYTNKFLYLLFLGYRILLLHGQRFFECCNYNNNYTLRTNDALYNL